MQCISTRDWPQGARAFLRRINSRPVFELVGMRELADAFGGRKRPARRAAKTAGTKRETTTNQKAGK